METDTKTVITHELIFDELDWLDYEVEASDDWDLLPFDADPAPLPDDAYDKEDLLFE